MYTLNNVAMIGVICGIYMCVKKNRDIIELNNYIKNIDTCEEIDELIAHNHRFGISVEQTISELTEKEKSIYFYNLNV